MNNTITQPGKDFIERYNFACKIAKSKSVLDIACEYGYSAPLFINAGVGSYDGIDIDKEKIAYASNRYADNNSLKNRVNYHVGDISNFNNIKTFDIITCFGIIEHIKDYEDAITNLYGLLNYGGALLISSPNRLITSPECESIDDKPSNKFHMQEFTPNELLSILVSSGFSVSQDKVFGQYQRNLYSDERLNKIFQVIHRKFKKRYASTVRVVNNKTPEHFIIVATKITKTEEKFFSTQQIDDHPLIT